MGDGQVAYCNRFESSNFSICVSFCICSVVLFIPSFHVLSISFSLVAVLTEF